MMAYPLCKYTTALYTQVINLTQSAERIAKGNPSMKPIFEPERLFLEQQLNVRLPKNCWRKSSKVFLNVEDKIPLLEFKALQGKITLTKYHILEIKDDSTIRIKYKGKEYTLKNHTYEEEYLKKETYLNELIEESLNETISYMEKYPDYEYRISLSGGKDSSLLLWMMQKVYAKLGRDIYLEVTPDAYNTSNDTAQTYLQIKKDIKPWVERIMDHSKVTDQLSYDLEFNKHMKAFIHSPEKGWYSWLKENKNWFLPSINVRNCCSTYKEGQVKKILDKNKRYVTFLGMRRFESQKRAFYEFDLDAAYLKKGKATNLRANWRKFCPIVNFKNEDVWLLILHYQIPHNKMYEYGYSRCGCLICPYASCYTDLLTRKYYPNLMRKWEYACSQNYDLYNIGPRLKWTKEEWQLGKWKEGTSKERELLILKKTKERVEQLAAIKGISPEIAEKYWDKQVCVCGKRLNPDEVALNLKLYGRYEGIEDTRTFKCKDCMCKDLDITKKQYQELVMEYRSSGCNLF